MGFFCESDPFAFYQAGRPDLATEGDGDLARPPLSLLRPKLLTNFETAGRVWRYFHRNKCKKAHLGALFSLPRQ